MVLDFFWIDPTLNIKHMNYEEVVFVIGYINYSCIRFSYLGLFV
jgi:hypothetical protein